MDEQASSRTLPTLPVAGKWNWDRLLSGAEKPALAAAMARAIATRRWFGSKTRAIASAEIVDAIGVSDAVRLLLAKIHFSRGPAEVYQVPLAFAEGDIPARLPGGGSAEWIRVESKDGKYQGVLYDALVEPDFCRQLLELFESPAARGGAGGELIVRRTEFFDRIRGARREPLAPNLVQAEQSNSSVIYGDRLILKMFRRVETGLNPDFEISEHLARQNFANTPLLAGTLEYRPARQEPWALAMLQAFVPNQGDAWKFTLDWLDASLHRLLATPAKETVVPPLPAEDIARAAEHSIPRAAESAFAEFLTSAELLGRRTGEMHRALAADAREPAFSPEPFSEADRRQYFDRCAREASATFELLREHGLRLTGQPADQARRVAALEQAALDRFARLSNDSVDVHKIRCHGDYHLGQVLATHNDFLIIDFEGEPARSVSQRREKQLALRDVAGMIRSLHYASRAAAAAAKANQTAGHARIDAWTHAWYAWSGDAFLAAYRRAAGDAVFLPQASDQFERLLDGCLLEKALYELRYELNNRPDWVYLPLEALEQLLNSDASRS